MFGILNINKPQGFTSHDVVARLRRILKIKQIGHTGTLDPLATGVLPICIGKSTKLIQYLDDTKAYRAYLKLGITTNTYDSEGEIIEQKEVPVDFEEKIIYFLKDFEGTIIQTPPIFSAVHYKGKRLYEYARQNIEIKDIPTRKVTINKINLVEVIDKKSQNPVAVVDIDCSSGTYVRSIIFDLGQKLGCGATMCGLERTRAGSLTIDNALTIVEVQNAYENGEINKILINPVDVIKLEKVSINEKEKEDITFGKSFGWCDRAKYFEGEVALISEKELCAVAEIKEGVIYPRKVFI